MKKYTSIFFCFACILFFGSCYYDKKDQIYIQPTATVCDTTNVTYTAVVAPIIKTNCSMCHSSAVANASGAGIVLDNYTSLKVYVSNNSLLNSIPSKQRMCEPEELATTGVKSTLIIPTELSTETNLPSATTDKSEAKSCLTLTPCIPTQIKKK